MTFPPDPPADLDSPEVIREHDWQAFRRVDVMRSHWDRPGWTDGRRSYHWMLSFHDAPAVQELARACQAQLIRSEFDPVPLDALHMTIGRVAFIDELARTALDAVTTIARERCKQLSAFPIEIGPLAGSRGALRFSISPWSPLLALHRAVGSATRDALGVVDRLNTEHFRPHVSIAYSNQHVSVTDLMPQVVPLRALAPVLTDISAVSLVELRREGRAYRFEEVERVDLGKCSEQSSMI